MKRNVEFEVYDVFADEAPIPAVEFDGKLCAQKNSALIKDCAVEYDKNSRKTRDKEGGTDINGK